MGIKVYKVNYIFLLLWLGTIVLFSFSSSLRDLSLVSFLSVFLIMIVSAIPFVASYIFDQLILIPIVGGLMYFGAFSLYKLNFVCNGEFSCSVLPIALALAGSVNLVLFFVFYGINKFFFQK